MDIYYKLGKKIKGLRERAGMSQENLAKRMKLSRSAVSQIESGERKIATDELLTLSNIFQVSMNDLVEDKKIEIIFEEKMKTGNQKKHEIRINVPQKKLEKFKQVFLYILNKVGSKPNIGETVIYKLLYFIDFNYYEKYEAQLIGATYQRNNYGPTPKEFIKIRDKMVNENQIEIIKSKYFEFPQTKYLPLVAPDLSKLCASEIEVIDGVLNTLSDMSAKQISAYSHGDVPWISTPDGEIIEYESVFYRTAPYSVRKDDSDQDE